MKTEIDDGGPAFPVHPKAMPVDQGMSLRDWFAGMALTGIQAPAADGSQYPTEQDVSEASYRLADAMIEARKLTQTP